jgi:hypothetical protein
VRLHGSNCSRVAKNSLTFALRQVLIFRALRTCHAPGKKVMILTTLLPYIFRRSLLEPQYETAMAATEFISVLHRHGRHA